ncbi:MULTISPECIES: hypothetical protein [Burkholderia]|uniref:Transcriptional regulator n=1 Tax=Burkholderia gladioli TaxID=28095 RepID=A0AAW3F2R5_BURGA|nr:MULTISPECIES: hypothetical protein [Burkholderia]AJW94646.1 hypothetical protein BM43_6814 [Burkholderia gladioli]ASD83422.1 hypothetical protein CEJ98_31640 [Burkholderia gladioli pv. gladioli]AWY50849.1 hypothetical protein A8H28_06405 [Burkholderia gladioli pv. gladioli]KGC14120.1 hypothetical protein DM48_953 [Burkholderia gladioli]MBU9186216.1 hypothetical protein [Burkholderia gladioli]
MQATIIKHYRGYAVAPSVHRLPDGSFSSNLTLRRMDRRDEAALYEFYSLDYFGTEEAALHHSDRWARDWIDTRG